MLLLSVSFLHSLTLVNTLTLCVEQGRRIAYGTSDGIYFSDSRNVSRPPVRVLALQDVTQIDVLEEYQLLIVLSGKFNSPCLLLW